MPTKTCNRVLVERYFLNETGAEERAAARAHLDGCEGCRGFMAELENRRREYLLAHPFREFAAKHLPQGKVKPKAAFGPRWLPAALGAAACLILVPALLMTQRNTHVTAHSDGDAVRTKGGTLLEYYVKKGATVRPGSSADVFAAGDELQFVYVAGKHAYATLASVDARGHVSLYRASDAVGSAPGASVPAGSLPGGSAAGNPTSGSSAANAADAGLGNSQVTPGFSQKVAGEGKQTLPFGVTLDDSPGAELFVMVFSQEPLSGAAMESWLQGAYTKAGGKLDTLATQLAPPRQAAGEGGSESASGAEIKVLLLRKSQA